MQKLLENRYLNIVAFALTIIVNGLANAIPLGGQTTGQVSAKYPALFTPSGFIFSIWGLIYLSLTLFIIYQALPSQRENLIINKISPYFKFNCIANAVWIIAWHYDYLIMSLLLMLAILITLIFIYRELGLTSKHATGSQYLFLYFPFSLYTAWITVATIANISAVQIGMDWDNVLTNAITGTLMKLALAGAIGATIIIRRGDIVFGAVIAWAAYGISTKQVAVASVAGAATTLTTVALLLIAAEIIRKFYYKDV